MKIIIIILLLFICVKLNLAGWLEDRHPPKVVIETVYVTNYLPAIKPTLVWGIDNTDTFYLGVESALVAIQVQIAHQGTTPGPDDLDPMAWNVWTNLYWWSSNSPGTPLPPCLLVDPLPSSSGIKMQPLDNNSQYRL